MSKYLITGSYTTPGIKGVMAEGGSGRLAAVTKLIASLGGSVESMYSTCPATPRWRPGP